MGLGRGSEGGGEILNAFSGRHFGDGGRQMNVDERRRRSPFSVRDQLVLNQLQMEARVGIVRLTGSYRG